jgi:hypothetical protein
MTANADPSPDRVVGTALVFPSRIASGLLAQAESLIVPVCAPTVVDVWVNATRSKGASGSCAHVRKHIDGASTIHSAESVSGDLIQSWAEKPAPVETLRSASVTVLALTATLAEMVSPGRTASGSSMGGAGKS